MDTGNKNIVLVMGPPNTGKTASLRNLRNMSSMVYLNTDMKDLSFRGKFLLQAEVSDANNIGAFISQIEQSAQATGAVLDTLTFLMRMYERQYVKNATNTQKAWGYYADFYGQFIHDIKAGTKDYAILAHEDIFLNEQTAQMESKVPVKGSVGKTGVEADFTTIVATRQVPLSKLAGYENDLLTITPEDEEDGFKHVFVTRVTKEYVGGKMRAPMDMWSRKELYINNDVQLVFDRLKQYFG